MNNSTSIWHTLWHLIRYAQKLYWADTILWLFVTGLPAIPGVIIREFFNTLTEETSSLLSVWGWVAVFLAIGLARITAIFMRRITKTQHRFTMSSLVRHNLLRGLMERSGAVRAVRAVRTVLTLLIDLAKLLNLPSLENPTRLRRGFRFVLKISCSGDL